MMMSIMGYSFSASLHFFPVKLNIFSVEVKHIRKMHRHYQIIGWWNVKFNNRNAGNESQSEGISSAVKMMKRQNEKKEKKQEKSMHFEFYSSTLRCSFFFAWVFTNMFHPFFPVKSTTSVISIQFIDLNAPNYDADEHQLFFGQTKSKHSTDRDHLLGWNKNTDVHTAHF